MKVIKGKEGALIVIVPNLLTVIVKRNIARLKATL